MRLLLVPSGKEPVRIRVTQDLLELILCLLQDVITVAEEEHSTTWVSGAEGLKGEGRGNGLTQAAGHDNQRFVGTALVLFESYETIFLVRIGCDHFDLLSVVRDPELLSTFYYIKCVSSN